MDNKRNVDELLAAAISQIAAARGYTPTFAISEIETAINALSEAQCLLKEREDRDNAARLNIEQIRERLSR